MKKENKWKSIAIESEVKQDLNNIHHELKFNSLDETVKKLMKEN